MTGKGIRVTVCVLTTAVFLSGNSLSVNAAGVSGSLPAAGFSLAMEEGSSLKSVKEEVKDIVKNSSEHNSSAGNSGSKLTVSSSAITPDKEIVEPLVATASAPEQILMK